MTGLTPHRHASGILFVTANPRTPDQDAEFNAWYDEVHVPEVLDVVGVLAATRFRLSPHQVRDTPIDFAYAALYELDDVAAVCRGIRERATAGGFTMSDAIAPSRRLLVFEPITGRRMRDS